MRLKSRNALILPVCITLGTLLLNGALSFAQDEDAKGIYGEDGRQDYFEAAPKLQALADSSVALIEKSDTRDAFNWLGLAAPRTHLRGKTYGRQAELCKEERFYKQKMSAFCSGSLVGPDLILTAGHCVTDETSCAGTEFVFGFSIKEKGAKTPKNIAKSEVYGCKRLITRTQEARGADFALVQLDRPVVGHKPLKLNRSKDLIARGTSLVIIGHPMGLPTKITVGAHVWDPNQNGYFTSDADTYGGNSGSPVLNATTGLIEGILVRGGKDFQVDWNSGCSRSYVCNSSSATETCRGEDITKISEVQALIPELSRL